MSCSAVSSCGGTEDVFVRASSAHGVHLADADGVLQGDLLPDVGRYILYVGAGMALVIQQVLPYLLDGVAQRAGPD